MPTEAELMKAIVAAPDDDAPREAYAAWCAQQDSEVRRAQAEFIRLQLLLASREYDPMRPPVAHWYREETLLKVHRAAWLMPLGREVRDAIFRRGFPECVTLSAVDFLGGFGRIRLLAPVRHVDLVEVGPVKAALLGSASLAGIRSLGLDGQGLDDADAVRLADNPAVASLRWLSVRNNRLGETGVEAVYRSPFLRELRALLLGGNPYDPRETYASDNDLVTARWVTPEGARLERTYGPRAWMYGAGERVGDWVPSRFDAACLR